MTENEKDDFNQDEINIEQEEETVVPDDENEQEAADENEDTNQEEELEEGDIEEEEPDELVITVGDEKIETTEKEKAPEFIKELRKANREKAKRIKELEARLQASLPAEQKEEVLGAKPKLEDFDYDTERFEEKLSQWVLKKQRVEKEQENKRQEEKRQMDAWNARLLDYEKKKNAMRVDNFDEAEENVRQSLTQTQLGILVQGADDPALMVYVLGKNKKKAEEISQISDPVKFAFAIAKLQGEIKVNNVKKPPMPQPERTLKGQGGGASKHDKVLAALEAKAERTGDRTEIFEYKRKLRS